MMPCSNGWRIGWARSLNLGCEPDRHCDQILDQPAPCVPGQGEEMDEGRLAGREAEGIAASRFADIDKGAADQAAVAHVLGHHPDHPTELGQSVRRNQAEQVASPGSPTPITEAV